MMRGRRGAGRARRPLSAPGCVPLASVLLAAGRGLFFHRAPPCLLCAWAPPFGFNEGRWCAGAGSRRPASRIPVVVAPKGRLLPADSRGAGPAPVLWGLAQGPASIGRRLKKLPLAAVLLLPRGKARRGAPRRASIRIHTLSDLSLPPTPLPMRWRGESSQRHLQPLILRARAPPTHTFFSVAVFCRPHPLQIPPSAPPL